MKNVNMSKGRTHMTKIVIYLFGYDFRLLERERSPNPIRDLADESLTDNDKTFL